jgi:hypothetical protein
VRVGDRHPVAAGLLALVGVSLAIGLIAGLGTFVGVKATGLGSTELEVDSTSGQSMFLPTPQKTAEAGGKPSPEDSPDETKSEPESQIKLDATQTQVNPMEPIDLTGTYPGGDGVFLQVQRLRDGKWQDFPVTLSVRGDTFATYVQTAQPGKTKFRVVDPESGATSNSVEVMIG